MQLRRRDRVMIDVEVDGESYRGRGVVYVATSRGALIAVEDDIHWWIPSRLWDQVLRKVEAPAGRHWKVW